MTCRQMNRINEEVAWPNTQSINSASLRFIPLDELESEGYGEYLKLFEPKKEK
jgi:hypothetical protein